MTTSDYVLSFGLLALILSTSLGTRPLTRRRFTLPLIAVAIAGSTYLRAIPTIGNDVPFISGAALVGVVLGVVAGLLCRLDRDAHGRLVTRAGAAFAATWLVAVGGRVLFGYGATHWWRGAVVRFSIQHHITGPAYTTAFVLMALTMVLARLAVVGIQAAAIQPATVRPAVSAAR